MRRFLLLILFPIALVSQTTAPALGSVDGRVTNAQTGDGIAGATLRLSPAGARAGANLAVVQTATSQPDGSFHFDGVAPGTYLVVAVRGGFARSDGTQASQVLSVGDGQQVTGVAVQLIPQGSISGKLLDEDENPVSGRVEAFMAYVSRGKTKLRLTSSADAQETGDYILTNLTPGKYFLVAEPDEEPVASNTEQSRFQLVRTFYPKTLNFESATPIDIAAGQNVPATDIHLQQAATYHVRGKVERLPGTPGLRATLSLSPAGAGQAALAQTQPPKTDETFDIDKVLPGSYVLQLTGMNGAGLVGILARQEIQVSAADVDGVVLSVIPPLTITGRVTLEGVEHPNLSQVRVNLIPTEEEQLGFLQTVQINADGTFSVENLNPGEYIVRVASGPTGTYVKAISFNRQEITTGVMNVSQGGSGELEVVLRSGAAEVDGTVQTRDSPETMNPRLTVALISVNVAPDGSGILFGSALPGGNFSIRNVPPGHYYAFAIEKWNTIWQNADFLREMQSRGTTVDVQERAHLEIQLRPITSDEIRETAARLGLTFE